MQDTHLNCQHKDDIIARLQIESDQYYEQWKKSEIACKFLERRLEFITSILIAIVSTIVCSFVIGLF